MEEVQDDSRSPVARESKEICKELWTLVKGQRSQLEGGLYGPNLDNFKNQRK